MAKSTKGMNKLKAMMMGSMPMSAPNKAMANAPSKAMMNAPSKGKAKVTAKVKAKPTLKAKKGKKK